MYGHSNLFQCPHCGAKWELVPVAEQQPEQRRAPQTIQRGQETTTRYTTLADSTRSKFGEVASAPTFTEARRTSPARAASVESDVSVPLLQSAVTGLVVMLGSVPFVVAAHGTWYVPFLAGGATFAVSWLFLLRDHRSLLKVVEVIINKDIDNDGKVGPKQAWRVQGEIRHEHGDRPASLSLFDLPCPSPEDLKRFAQSISAGRSSFAERDAAEYHYSDTMWEAIRDDFVNRGWAFWKHPTARQQGVGLTAAGRAVVRMIADTPLP
jgi:hypothetical protein